MTWFRFALAPSVIALILTLSPGAGLAGEATFELAQAFHDLPGVRPVDPLRDDKNIVCRQVFIDRYGPFESSHGPPALRYDLSLPRGQRTDLPKRRTAAVAGTTEARPQLLRSNQEKSTLALHARERRNYARDGTDWRKPCPKPTGRKPTGHLSSARPRRVRSI
jgi:hypothetical protein